VWCGRFVSGKNVLTLIEVFAEARQSNAALQLVLIGDGPVRQEAERKIKNLGLEAGSSIDNEVADVIPNWLLVGFLF